MRILIVKLSSLGDVVHAMPVVHDIRSAHPDAVVDWVVEPAFATCASGLTCRSAAMKSASMRCSASGVWPSKRSTSTGVVLDARISP